MINRSILSVSISAILSASLLLAVPCPAADAAKIDLVRLQAGAKKNDPDALLQLGRAYIEGNGVPHDEKKAAECFRKAAKLGSWKAQHNIGLMYARGTAVEKNSTEALKWLRQAANQGAMTAQLDLATMLTEGADLPKDPKEAAQWYEKAALQGSCDAQSQLGKFYYFGDQEGIPTDYVVAAKWLKMAADQKDPWAQTMLGSLFEFGRGVQKDLHLAADLYRKAAEQGFARGQSRLGMLLAYNNPGIEKDQIEGYKWLSLGAEQGDVTAVNGLKGAALGMKPEELTEAHRRAEEFKQRKKTRRPPLPPHHRSSVHSSNFGPPRYRRD